MKNNHLQRIESLRTVMAEAGVDAAIIPQADPHMSEYLASHWQFRRFLSGFTGSAGTLVVTATEALLWTDSRYFLQAASQLEGSGIALMKDGLASTPSICGYLSAHLPEGSVVGVDGMLLSSVEFDAMAAELADSGIRLDPGFSAAERLWEERPALPDCKIFVHGTEYAGVSAKDKIKDIMASARAAGADSVWISALDEIAWTLNIRSKDVAYNPVATSFLYLSEGKEGSVLFIDPAKLSAETTAYLAGEGVKTMGYGDAMSFLSGLGEDARVLIEPSHTAAAVRSLLGRRAVLAAKSPAAMAKACKNETQIEGVRRAMARDGVAMVKSLMEIERRMASGEKTTEMDVARILLENRQKGELFFDESFGTIAGYGPHGAIVHYEADEASNSELKPEGLLLIDSGAQYLDGTTDITRTICLGTPTAQEKSDFTLVMKGHIALARMVFPDDTRGAQLDAVARQFLWKHGLSYLHGTGHGVGHFLNVHEGPQSIRLNYVNTPLAPGMITSNEPGVYREGVHGIRCENLVLCRHAMTTEFGTFLKFETLTMCPFDLNLFDTDMMTAEETDWVNEYHANVRKTLSPLLSDTERRWLDSKTKRLEKK